MLSFSNICCGGSLLDIAKENFYIKNDIIFYFTKLTDQTMYVGSICQKFIRRCKNFEQVAIL